MATTAAKARVTNRNRLIRLADVGLAIIVLSIPLQFWDDFTSFMLACLGSCVTGFGVSKLRKTIDSADLPTIELDEYMLQLHIEAREDGLKLALFSSMFMFVACGAIALGTRFLDSMDGIFVASLFFKLIMLQMLWVPFTVAKSLAGKFNRDELISGD
ncbi:hypothetical protein HMPREF3155_04455 [Corynebacterium sp. HMSC06D04]|uniref:Membrane protein n=1 Tax=Corynebacterium simulans TaxID=146827 RepID=A0ABR5VBJ0_9CORY|nr:MULTISPECIES: hypothetical protein [Corynebacterium]MDU3175660.1 hypothetical protein [Corynebacterium striatum]AMO91264.1 putative membrane protein [Corynebacterium simulans]KXU18951.1 putative membrane protein [Corynebacterium simulans]MCK6160767.1 hypothetical protein [Corynebacterium simulans]MDK7137821.1 hypothetical protein [Corynebacterium simulans]